LWREARILPQEVRRHFKGVFVDGQGRLGLIARRQKEAVICLSAQKELLLESRRGAAADKRYVKYFEITAAPPGVGYELRAARWSDGSVAWLDSRGMLHLKSSDKSLPEVTLVLRNGRMAGWISTGQTFGKAYFAGEPFPGMEVVVYEKILKSFVARLQ
jgi:hypothetical protein